MFENVALCINLRVFLLFVLGLACLIDRVDREEVGIAADGAVYRYHPTFKSIVEENIPAFLQKEKTVGF